MGAWWPLEVFRYYVILPIYLEGSYYDRPNFTEEDLLTEGEPNPRWVLIYLIPIAIYILTLFLAINIILSKQNRKRLSIKFNC